MLRVQNSAPTPRIEGKTKQATPVIRMPVATALHAHRSRTGSASPTAERMNIPERAHMMTLPSTDGGLGRDRKKNAAASRTGASTQKYHLFIGTSDPAAAFACDLAARITP